MRDYQCQHCGSVFSSEKKPAGLCPKGCASARTDKNGFPIGYQTSWRVVPLKKDPSN